MVGQLRVGETPDFSLSTLSMLYFMLSLCRDFYSLYSRYRISFLIPLATVHVCRMCSVDLHAEAGSTPVLPSPRKKKERNIAASVSDEPPSRSLTLHASVPTCVSYLNISSLLLKFRISRWCWLGLALRCEFSKDEVPPQALAVRGDGEVGEVRRRGGLGEARPAQRQGEGQGGEHALG